MPKKTIKFYEDAEKTLQVYPELDPEEIPAGVKELLTEGSTITGEGSSLTLDSDILKIKDLQLLGNTEQTQLSGKNILDINSISNYGNVTNVKNNDGTIATSGLPSGNYLVFCNIDITDKLENGETYTISQSQANNKVYLQVSENYKSNGTNHKRYYLAGQKSDTIQVDTTLYNYNVSIQTGLAENWGNSSQSFTQYYQIEKSSTATSYEPYCGGVPSPNPDYPQDIDVVTGNQTIQCCGKNLYNDNKEADNYYYDNNGIQQPGGTQKYINQEYYISNKSLVISFNSKVGNAYVRVVEFNNNTFIKRSLLNTNGGTLTLDNNTNRVIFCVDKTDNQYSTDYFNKLQIEFGDTPTSYEQYSGTTFPISLGTIELCKIGNYQDKIYKQNDKWYLEKNIGKYTFTGAETIWKETEGFLISEANWNTYTNNNCLTNSILYSNYYTNYKNYSDLVAQTYGIGIIYNDLNNLYIRNTTISNVDNFKNWLKTHNTNVYYILKIPTITEITDTTLINQLNSIELNSGQNNIYVLSENDNLPVLLNIEAYTNVIDILDLKADKDDLKNMGDGIPTGSIIGWNGDDSEIPGGYEITGLNNILYFDTVADMKSANLNEGDCIKTLGYYSVDDGGGTLYKIRTKTNEDTPNNMTIIQLDNPTLVAILCIEDNVKLKQLGAKNDEDISSILQFAIDLTKEKYTLIIDDYYLLEDSVNIDKPVIIKGDVSTYSNNGSCGFNCNKNENIVYFNFNEGSANCVIDHLVFKNNRLGTCIKFSSRDESLTDYRVWKNNFNKCRFQNFNVAINFYAIGDVTEYDYSSEMLFTDCKFYNNVVSCEYNNVQSYNTNFISTDFECSPTNSGKGFVLNAYGGINIIGGSIILHDSFIKLSQNDQLDPPNKYVGIINVSNCRFETFHETVFDYTLESRKTYYSINNLNINNTEIYTHNNDAVLIDNNIRELRALCNVTFSGGQPIYINGQNEQSASEFSRIIVNTPQPERVIVNYIGGQFTPWIIVNDTVLSSCIHVGNNNNHFNYKGKILLGFNKANKPGTFTITVPWYIRKFVMNVNGSFIANIGTITIHNSDSSFTHTFTKSVAGNTTVHDEVYLPYSDTDQELTIESDNIWGNCYFE